MIYILTTILTVCGVMFHVMQKVKHLREKFPTLTASGIWKTFMFEEWNTLIVSFLVWLVHQLSIFICIYHNVTLPMWYKLWGVYALALALGYCGQRVAYKYLGTAEKILEKRAEAIENTKP